MIIDLTIIIATTTAVSTSAAEFAIFRLVFESLFRVAAIFLCLLDSILFHALVFFRMMFPLGPPAISGNVLES